MSGGQRFLLKFRTFNKKNLKLFYGFLRDVFGSLTFFVAPLRPRYNIFITQEPAITTALHQFI